MPANRKGTEPSSHVCIYSSFIQLLSKFDIHPLNSVGIRRKFTKKYKLLYAFIHSAHTHTASMDSLTMGDKSPTNQTKNEIKLYTHKGPA